MKDDKLKQVQQDSGEVLHLLRDKNLSYAEISVVLRAAAGVAEAISTGEAIALSFANNLRR